MAESDKAVGASSLSHQELKAPKATRKLEVENRTPSTGLGLRRRT